MEGLNVILGGLVALFGGLNIFQFIFIRSTKKKYEADGEKAKTEADESKQSSLERRLAALENLYAEREQIVDNLRREILNLSAEKFENEKRILLLENENRTLNEKFVQLSKRLEAYETINGK